MLEYFDDEIEADDNADKQDVDEGTIINKLTNEEFSVRKTKNEEEGSMGIIMERAAKKKKH